VERLQDVEVAETGDAVAALPSAQERAEGPGLLGMIFGGQPPTPPPSVAPESADAAVDGDPRDLTAPAEAVAAAAPTGFFGRIFGPSAPSTNATPAAMSPETAPAAPGAMLPYGTIAAACGVSGAQLGTRIAVASGYELYDTNPTSVQPRTHYLTGFGDRCPRQLTAALATFGDVGTHEVVRYLPSNADMPWSQTDEAYERIKAQACGASRGQPCGGAIDRLARRTTFLTVYENFGTNPTWADVLLHDGEVAALDFEGR
jgi:hypothetical protein